MKEVNKSDPTVYVSVISEAMQWDCARNTLFLQAVNEYDVTMYVLRNYKLAIWTSENNNGSRPAHLLLLTVDTHVFAVLHVFMVFTKGLMVTNKGRSIYNWNPQLYSPVHRTITKHQQQDGRLMGYWLSINPVQKEDMESLTVWTLCSEPCFKWNLYMLKVVNNTTRYRKNVYSRY